MAVINLCDTYRPKSLKDVYGQDSVTYFFRSVVNNPEESPRYYLLQGGFGCGKTTISRCVAHDLLGPDYKNSPNYIEIDSSEKAIAENFDTIRDLIFQDVPGWKVVLIDESHLLPEQVSQKLLKVLEDYVGKLFIFFATTNPEKMFPPLLSRVHKFTLTTFTPEQCKEYGKKIILNEANKLTRESSDPASETYQKAQKLLSISDRALSVAALNCQGHLRDMLKQCEVILFQGEDYYLKSFSTAWSLIEDYFFGNDRANTVQKMYTIHPTQLKQFFSYYFRDQILNPNSEKYGKLFPANLLPKVFAKYLQLTAHIKDADDFFSFLYVFATILEAVKNV